MQGRVWYLKVWPGVRSHFRSRDVEWVMALWLIIWGGNLMLKPGESLVTHTGIWDGLRYWFHADWVVASIMATAGVANLVALTINGTFADTVYSRYSPLVRSITMGIGSLVWLSVWMSAMPANTQGAVVYWVPTLLCGMRGLYAMGEFGATLRRYHDRRRGAYHK